MSGDTPKPLNQLEIHPNTEFRQLQLQHPPLNRDGQLVKTAGDDVRSL